MVAYLYPVVKLRSSLRKFYGRHHDVANRYRVSVSQMITDMFCLSYYNHNPVPSLFVTYHRICNKSNTTGVTCGAGNAYPSGAPEFTTVFSGVRFARYLDFCEMFYRSLFVLLFVFLWPLYCLSFLDLRYLITPWIFSNFSKWEWCKIKESNSNSDIKR